MGTVRELNDKLASMTEQLQQLEAEKQSNAIKEKQHQQRTGKRLCYGVCTAAFGRTCSLKCSTIGLNGDTVQRSMSSSCLEKESTGFIVYFRFLSTPVVVS